MKPTVRQWHFLVNPAAGRGLARTRWQQWLPVLEASLPRLTWAESSADTGMTALAETAIRSGKVNLVGVGGDGTHHEILNGIIAAGGLGKVTYAPLPLGSGNDWVRTLGTPKEPKAWLKMLLAERTIEHGVGRLRYGKEPSAKFLRYFLNVAGMAYDAVVLRRADASPYKHRFLYPVMTLWFLRDFTAPTVRIRYDGGAYEGQVHTINLGIGRYSGGGMRLVPQADPQVETLALTFAERLPLLRILTESWRFYAGSIGKVKGVTLTKTKSVRVDVLSGELELEADGEWLGVGSVTVDQLGEGLRVVVP